MRSNMTLKIVKVIMCLVFLAMTACTSEGVNPDENVIGKRLKDINGLNTSHSGEIQKVVLFDEVVRKIHQFDLKTMKYEKSLEVRNPSEKHFVLYHHEGGYIVDITTKGITIFDKNGKATHDPIKLLGVPLSAAFRPDLGFLVIYDDLMTVGILHLNDDGSLASPAFGKGSVLDGAVIRAGDINDDGNLILSLDDDSIATVNLATTVSSGSWQKTDSFDSTLSDVSWVAPIPGGPNKRILVKSSGKKISLIDLGTKSVVDFQNSSYNTTIAKFSRSTTPHVILKSGYDVLVIYPDGDNVERRRMQHNLRGFLSSNLNIAADTWTFVNSDKESSTSEFLGTVYNNYNATKEDRVLNHYKFSEWTPIKNIKIENNTKIELAQTYIFSLFPSELGVAKRLDINTEKVQRIEYFNLDHIK